MVHLDGVVADTRRFSSFALFRINAGGAKSPFRAALTGHLIVLAVVLVDMMDSTTNKRKETNINARVV